MSINVHDIAQCIICAIKHKFPNEISIGDYQTNKYYVAEVNGTQYLSPTLEEMTLDFPEWITEYGLDHISFSLWEVLDDGSSQKLIQLSSNRCFYLAISEYLRRIGIKWDHIGAVDFDSEDRIKPVLLLQDDIGYYCNEIIIRFFMDAPGKYDRCNDSFCTRRSFKLEELETNNHYLVLT